MLPLNYFIKISTLGGGRGVYTRLKIANLFRSKIMAKPEAPAHPTAHPLIPGLKEG